MKKNEMNLIEKFKAKTPSKNKKRGIIWTGIAGAIGVILTAGVVTAPLGVALLGAGALFAGTMAGVHGAKVEDED